MALLSESRIYNDLLDLSVKVFEVSRTIPKDYRMSIGRRMEESVLEIGDHLLLANNAEGEECVRHHRLAMAAYERLQFIVNIGARTTVCMTDKGAVNAMKSVAKVKTYDYTVGYPEKINFDEMFSE